MKKTYLFGCLVLAVFSSQTPAEPSSRVAWTPAALTFVGNGDAERGKRIAQSCEGCHGEGTQTAGSRFPALRGQLATYLYKQLRDYQDGTRPNAIMAGFVAGLSDQDLADVAAWYSGQPIPAGSKAEAVSESAEQLAERGDGKRILAPCAACHKSDGMGQRIDVPALAGQNAAYTEQTLLAYRSGMRHNDLYGSMRSIAQQLSDEEIRQLARYYAGLGR